MAASIWRMNGLYRSMSGVLLLCALLFSSEVMCQSSINPDPNASTAAASVPSTFISKTHTPRPAESHIDQSIENSTDAPEAKNTTNSIKENENTGLTQDSAVTNNTKLGSTEIQPSSGGSGVFVGILVTGLLAALAIIVGCFKCQRRHDNKGAKLAEEAFPVDQVNQGNTLASEAPLIPPTETQEKPSVNGESLEAVKTETSPPTNGHSTAKTADTEL